MFITTYEIFASFKRIFAMPSIKFSFWFVFFRSFSKKRVNSGIFFILYSLIRDSQYSSYLFLHFSFEEFDFVYIHLYKVTKYLLSCVEIFILLS